MTGAVAVLAGMGLTVGALVGAPVVMVVFALGTARVRRGSRRWHGVMVFCCVPGVLVGFSLGRAAMSSAVWGAPQAPAWHGALLTALLLLYAAGSIGSAIALLMPQTYRYLRAGVR
ncbi:hypothetical protein [Virgisporangium ochraceum]|nr:hypothetical protein [Virgisporangium ochraceum]